MNIRIPNHGTARLRSIRWKAGTSTRIVITALSIFIPHGQGHFPTWPRDGSLWRNRSERPVGRHRRWSCARFCAIPPSLPNGRSLGKRQFHPSESIPGTPCDVTRVRWLDSGSRGLIHRSGLVEIAQHRQGCRRVIDRLMPCSCHAHNLASRGKELLAQELRRRTSLAGTRDIRSKPAATGDRAGSAVSMDTLDFRPISASSTPDHHTGFSA